MRALEAAYEEDRELQEQQYCRNVAEPVIQPPPAQLSSR
jgi:hypothetical protein